MKSTICSMRILFVVSLLSLSLGTHVQAQWPTDFQNTSGTFFEFGAKIYDRPGDDFGFPVIVDGVTNATLLDSGDITDLNGGAGAEVRFGSTGPRGRKWEVRTFLTNWGNEFSFDQMNLTSPLSPAIDPDSIELDYDSEYYSIEFSLKRAITPGVTLLAGPRFISFNEDLLFTSETNIPTPPLGSFDLSTSNALDTTNSMIGGQIGALINYPITRDVYIQGFIRSSGFVNFTELRNTASNTLMSETVSTIRQSTGSFVGEVGGKVYMDFVPGALSGFLGYEATWIDGIALAPAQAVTLTPSSILTEVTPFFQAVTFGFQYRR